MLTECLWFQVVHAPGNMKDNTALATFLLGQSNYSYFGTSNGWTDGGWTWHTEYSTPGKISTQFRPRIMWQMVGGRRQAQVCIGDAYLNMYFPE